MNFCSFTGFLVDDPVLTNRNNVSVVNFTLVTYTYRRTKSTGEKSRTPTFLSCEAWHTGAETIKRFAKKGSKMTIFGSAKNSAKGSKDIVFRVNEFDFAEATDNENIGETIDA